MPGHLEPQAHTNMHQIDIPSEGVGRASPLVLKSRLFPTIVPETQMQSALAARHIGSSILVKQGPAIRRVANPKSRSAALDVLAYEYGCAAFSENSTVSVDSHSACFPGIS